MSALHAAGAPRLFPPHRELRLAQRRLAAQFAVTRVLAESTRLDEAIVEILACVAPALGVARAVHFAADEEGALSPVRRWPATTSAPEPSLAGHDPLAIALRSGEVVAVNALLEARSVGAFHLAAEGVVAVGGVPIAAGLAPEGVLAFYAEGDEVIDETAGYFLADLGTRLSQFIHCLRASDHWDAHARVLAEQSDQLSLARDAALGASDLKSSFLARVSHELRTPLSGVVGMANLLLEGRLDPPERELSELLASSANGLRSIIDDLLDFSKLDSGRVECETLEVDVGELVEQVTAQFGPAAAARGVDLVCSLDPAFAAPLFSDPTRLRQVLANLVANAVKFTHAGHIAVSARLARDRGLDLLRVEVRDTGIGIAPEKAARLFQPFSQGDDSTTRQYGGTGLGLAICRQLVELLGGTIELESALGRGSTFRFSVPVRLDPEAAAPLTPLAGILVLIADDQAASREAARAALEGAGARVVALSHREARQLARAPRPAADVLLLGLEGADDRDVEAALGLLPASAACAVLLPPGASNTALERCGVAAHAIGHKPVRPSVVVGRVLAALGLVAELPPVARPSSPIIERRGRALVAEDDHVNQVITSSYLRRLGYEVDLVSDGGAAIAAAERGGYEVLVLDAHMPVLDGLAVARRVRALPDARAHVRIIALTAGVTAEDRAGCLGAGMDDFVAKPATSEALDAALRPARGAAGSSISRSGTWAARQSPLIDRLRLRELFEVDPSGEVGREVLHLFRTSIDERLERLVAGLADAAATQAEAHAVKGAAESVGATSLAHLARRLESAAARGDLEGAPALLAEARLVFVRSVDALDKALAAPAP